MSRRLGDDVLVRRASRRLATQAAVLVGGAMLLLVVLVSFVVVRGQQQANDAQLRTTARTADDVGDPPAGAFIVLDQAGLVAATPGLPAELDTGLARLRAAATPTPEFGTMSADDGEPYRVVTLLRPGRVVQVVLDLSPQEAARSRLLGVMGIAAAASMAVAVALGVLLGRRAVRPLSEALSLQRAFVADASHELRTPLTLLSTRAQLLERGLRRSAASPQVLTDVSGVVSDVHRLGEVVEDMLVAADPRRDDEHDIVDLGALVRAVVGSAAPHAATSGVTLSAELPDDPAPLLVTGSAPALRRALLALVDNAVDHTPDGGSVRLTGRREAREVVLAVSDTGPGIDPAAGQDVLRRFHSGAQRSGRAHYGLGLSLTHDVVNRHGGRLRLAPSAVGTTFEVSLRSAEH